MPEGDTIHYNANRIRPVLAGHVPDELETPHPRFTRDRWPERLEGRAVRSVDDALLDQRSIAGIGNMWKVEGCFAAGIDPWRRTGDVTDDEALAIVQETRPRMRISATDGNQDRWRTIYGKAGRPCPRCGP